MAIHKDFMRFIVMEDTPEAWADWEAKYQELDGTNGGIEPENITLIMPDLKTPISDRAYSQQFMHEILPEDMLDVKITTKRKWENRHRARIGLGMVEEIIQVAPHIKAYDWHKPFTDED